MDIQRDRYKEVGTNGLKVHRYRQSDIEVGSNGLKVHGYRKRDKKK